MRLATAPAAAHKDAVHQHAAKTRCLQGGSNLARRVQHHADVAVQKRHVYLSIPEIAVAGPVQGTIRRQPPEARRSLAALISGGDPAATFKRPPPQARPSLSGLFAAVESGGDDAADPARPVPAR